VKLIKLGAAVLNQTPLDWQGNLANIRSAIAMAREQGVSILCLPELCITGYGCEDAFLSPGVQRTASDILAELIADTQGMVMSVGLPVYHQKGLFNAAALIVDAQLVGLAAKRHLAGDGLHYEPRWFKPWPEGKRSVASVAGVEVPIGDLYFDVGGVGIGFEICEDAWVAKRPGSWLATQAVDVILNPSASHFAFDKKDVRERFVIEGSRAFGVAYVYANLLGNEAGRAIYDGDAHIASCGKLIATGSRFSFRDVELTCGVVDLDDSRMTQAQTASFQPDIDRESPVRVTFEFPETAPEAGKVVTERWEQGGRRKEESFARAVSLALFDYMRKSRSQGFVVSLSGGADSAAVACLVALMVELGVAELGLEGFVDRSGVGDLDECKSNTELVSRLLTCAYQSTRNSSDTTRDAARGVAEAVGAKFFDLDVDALVSGYTELIEAAIGRDLTWEQDDITLQNIQARARGPSVWMLANIRNALLLATSNRSEAAVGYATMDGDTCGGLSPIAGIDKAFLRHWLRWLEVEGPVGGKPIPALAAVNAQAPTAELRPQSEGQTDEGDLMPYELLDAIEGSAIRDRHTPLEVLREMEVAFPAYSRDQLGNWIERFFTLWCRNQWKRERYAPSFHVDDKNLDPKTWCRFPILSGGYRRELAAMRAFIEENR
jgi:NAD+ synthase (glutamine-hydrolysing)